jgi:hypothetical protein
MPRFIRTTLHASLALALLAMSAAAAEARASAADAEPAGALARLLAGEVALAEVPDLRITVGCLKDGGWRSLELFSDGLGFWGERTQIRLSPNRMEGILESFRSSGFAEWAEEFGRSPEGPKTPPPPKGSGQPARMICQVRLAAAGEAKEVRQFDKGEVSEALRRLAYEILAAGEEVAGDGLTVGGLSEGLRKLQEGELDRRALELQVHRRPAEPAGAEAPGWILRMRGLEAELQRYSAAGTLGPIEIRRLERGAFEALVRSLVEHGMATLPPNLWSAQYTDLRLSVLGFAKEVQARQFAGMTPTTHGERQADFSALFDVLQALYQDLASPADGRGAG